MRLFYLQTNQVGTKLLCKELCHFLGRSRLRIIHYGVLGSLGFVRSFAFLL